ncbi:MAG: MFS transporter [Alphaproteobacteria bacterium]|nr:MFS transporter [Alphaproteobacteria bacterium]
MRPCLPGPLSGAARAALASPADESTPIKRPKLPRSIWALGFVSLFMDISSEMIHALLPVFLVTVLGTSTLTVGMIEGVGEATASISKLFSGWFSDKLGRHKILTVVGYGLSTLSKPLFALAPVASWVLFARFSDRIGKGIRGAPRDSLISSLVPADRRGAAYGLRQSLDTVGAFVGPILAMILMALFADNFRLVFWVAVIPGLIAVAILVVMVREPARRQAQESPPLPASGRGVNWTRFGALGGPFREVIIVGTLLTLARFSEAFLILRAEGMSLPFALVPVVLIIMNIVYAAAAYPIGALSDKVDKRTLLTGGFAVLIIADIVLALAPNIWVVMVGVALWGLHMGMTQSLLVTLVANSVPSASRGTAFGIFHLVTGIALLAASLIAGMLWDLIGPSATFLGGAGFAIVGLCGLVVVNLRQRKQEIS